MMIHQLEKIKRWSLGVFALILLLLGISCSYNGPPSHLVDGVKSRQNLASFTNRMKAKGYNVVNLGSPDGQRVSTVAVKNYVLIGVSGDLYVDFLDDRLAKLSFYPSNYKKFASRYKSQKTKKDSVAYDAEWKGKDGYTWRDEGLQKEMEEWAWNR